MKADTVGISKHCRLTTYTYINRERLTVHGVDIFSREISQLSNIHPPPILRSHLGSSPKGIFLRDYGT